MKLKPELIDNKKLRANSDQKEITDELKTLISKLPPKAKEACKMILLENLNYEEAAKIANCSVKVFCDRFYEGLKIVRKKMNAKFFE